MNKDLLKDQKSFDFTQNQRGVVHILGLLVALAAIGIIAFLLISSSAPFKNNLFSKLFPKPASRADTIADLSNYNLLTKKAISFWNLDVYLPLVGGSLTYSREATTPLPLNTRKFNPLFSNSANLSDGISGKGVKFDSNDDEFLSNGPMSYTFTDLSVSAWVNLNSSFTPPNSGNVRYIAGQMPEWSFWYGDGNKLGFSARDSGCVNSFTPVVTSNLVLPVDQHWHHVAVTRNGTTGDVIFYLDGIPEQFSAATGAICNTTKAYIGIGSSPGLGAALQGSIDEVGIWGYLATEPVLKDEEIKLLHSLPTFPFSYVFVTSATYNGNLKAPFIDHNGTTTNPFDSGLLGADARCQDRADSSLLTDQNGNKLLANKKWKAWLSDSNSPVYNRLSRNDFPYRLVNGVPIADNWTDMTTNIKDTASTILRAPINVTEQGKEAGLSSDPAWTNTSYVGQITNTNNCANWTSSDLTRGNTGQPLTSTTGWTASGDGTCNSNYLLYCFEQPKAAAENFTKVSPANGSTVSYGPTTFSWTKVPLTGPYYQFYVLEIYNASSSLPALKQFFVSDINQTSTTIDLSTVPGLSPGQQYTWQLFANNGGNSQGEAADNGTPLSFRADTQISVSSENVFVTSATYDGNLKASFIDRNGTTIGPFDSGLLGADARCQDAADNVGIGSSFGKYYKAWITDSNSGNSPANRMLHSNVPYKMLTGEVVANNWDDLIDGTLAKPIYVTEKRTGVTNSVWTNTIRNGTIFYTTPDRTCNNWTSSTEVFGQTARLGLSSANNVYWTNSGNDQTCNIATNSLYCFEQSPNATPTPVPTPIPTPLPTPVPTPTPSPVPAPGNLQTTGIAYNQVNLTWVPPTNNGTIIEYDLFRDGSLRAVTSSTSFIDISLSSSTNYKYEVRSKDNNFNPSVPSNSITVITPAQPSPTPVPTPSANPIGSNLIIYAAGTIAKGVYPTMKLTVNVNGSWKDVFTWNNISGNPATRSFSSYTYQSPTKLAHSAVRVKFTNDTHTTTEDRNLVVDKINIDGVDYQTEANSVYGSGALKNGSCTKGYLLTEWLNCNGYFQY